MKSAAIASLLFAGVALAAPVAEKRDVQTDVVVTTIWTTTTVYVDKPSGAAFFERPKHSSSVSVSASSTASPLPSSSAAPAPSVAAAVAAPSAVPSVAPAPQAPAAAPPSSGSGPSGVGDVTYYTVSNGVPGSCGIQKSDSDYVVALSHLTMGNGANSNNNPLCGKTINIQGETQVFQAMIYDTCEGCSAESIDLSPSLFQAAFPKGDGRVHNVRWWVS